MRIIQHVDREVWDGDSSRGSECDQQHQNAFAFLQWQVQLVCLLFTEKWKVNSAPKIDINKHTKAQKENDVQTIVDVMGRLILLEHGLVLDKAENQQEAGKAYQNMMQSSLELMFSWHFFC